MWREKNDARFSTLFSAFFRNTMAWYGGGAGAGQWLRQ
jgi:hypothetical protein